MSEISVRTSDPGTQRDTSPLVGAIVGKSVVVVRHAENLTLAATHVDLPADASPRPSTPDGGLDSIQRALIAGAGSVRFGEWVVEIGSVGAMHLNRHVHETHVHHTVTNAEAVLAAVHEIQRGVDADRSLSSLRDYMAALRQACAQAPYISLRSSLGLAGEYVPLFGSIPQCDDEVPDVVRQVGFWLSSDQVAPIYVEGGPGTGKTTALYRLASYAWDNPEAVGLEHPHLPMLVRLRHLGREAGVSAEERLWAAVRAAGELMIMGDVPAPGFMADWSRRMGASWLILLDAFDELPVRERAKTRLWLAGLQQVAGFRTVITTRQLALLGGPLLDTAGAKRLVIGSLPQDRQELLSTNILHDRAEKFWAAVRGSDLGSVMTTPFDIAIAAAVYRSRQTLPQSRAHLIHRFLESALEEAQLQGLDDQMDVDALGPMLESIALASATDVGATRETALDAVVDVLTRLRSIEDPVLLEDRARRLLDVLADRSGIFRIEGDLLAWSHALFGDLLAALAIARRSASASAEGIQVATTWFDQDRRTALFFLLAIWSDRRGFGLRGLPSDATAPIAAILNEEEYDPDPGRVIRVSEAFIEGARASEALEQRIIDLITADPTPFTTYNACARLFASERDAVDVIEALCRVPRFLPRCERLAKWASEWVRSSDERRAHAGAAVLGFTGRWRELLSAAGDEAISVRNVEIGAHKLTYVGLQAEAIEVLQAVRARADRRIQSAPAPDA